MGKLKVVSKCDTNEIKGESVIQEETRWIAVKKFELQLTKPFIFCL